MISRVKPNVLVLSIFAQRLPVFTLSQMVTKTNNYYQKKRGTGIKPVPLAFISNYQFMLSKRMVPAAFTPPPFCWIFIPNLIISVTTAGLVNVHPVAV